MQPKDTLMMEALAGGQRPQPQKIPTPKPQQMIKGKGGGLSDFVPATIEGQEPAALSEGEFVIPADVVSMLGDGSSDAGSRILQNLCDKVRKVKGHSKQADPIKDLLKKSKKNKKK